MGKPSKISDNDLTLEQMEAITVDATYGRSVSYSTEAERAYRRQMDQFVAEVKLRGGTIDLPHEHPKQ